MVGQTVRSTVFKAEEPEDSNCVDGRWGFGVFAISLRCLVVNVLAIDRVPFCNSNSTVCASLSGLEAWLDNVSFICLSNDLRSFLIFDSSDPVFKSLAEHIRLYVVATRKYCCCSWKIMGSSTCSDFDDWLSVNGGASFKIFPAVVNCCLSCDFSCDKQCVN